MARNEAGVARQLRILFRAGTATGLSDGELLNRFSDGQSEAAEAAFGCLVERYGAMVLRVCRGVLQNPHDAEDAFQATFLVLALRPDAVRDRDAVGSWLFGVARRTAHKAKVASIRRLAREKRKAEMSGTSGRESRSEAWADLHEEVDRLPEKYRTPVVLCYFAGLTHEEAAGQLRLPVGTVKVRLSRARERLRGRLVRRGLAPAVVAGALSGEAALGAVPTRLVESTIQVALRTLAGRAGISASVATLVKGVLRIMLLSKLKTAAGGLAAGLTLFLTAAFALSVAPSPARSGPPVVEARQAPNEEEEKVAEPDKKTDEDGSGKVVVDTIKKADFNRVARVAGTVQAAQTADLRPRISGYLKSVAADIGDVVEKGQVLAEVDAPESAVDAERAAAVVEQAEARLLGAQAAVEVAEAAVEASKSRLETATLAQQGAESSVKSREKSLQRMQALFERAAIDQGRVDEAESAVETAKLAAAESLGEVSTARSAIKEAAAKLTAANADVHKAEADLRIARADERKVAIGQESTRITAPLDGVVTTRGYHVGDYVRSGGEGAAAPLFTIVKTDKMRVVVDVAESDIPSLDVGDRATVRLNSLQGRKYEGTVSRIAYAEDPQNRTLRTEIDLDNADGKLRPGQNGVVSIVLQTDKNVLVIPTSAVFQKSPQDGMSCYRVVDGRAVLTGIQLGHSHGKYCEIQEGLNEGDTVIAKPDKSINDGQAVEVEGKDRAE